MGRTAGFVTKVCHFLAYIDLNVLSQMQTVSVLTVLCAWQRSTCTLSYDTYMCKMDLAHGGP